MAQALQQDQLPLAVRLLLKLPWLRNFPAHLIAFGPRRVRVNLPRQV